MALNLADLLQRELAGPESQSPGFSTEKTVKSYDESALRNQQKYAGASQFIFAIAYIAQKCRNIFKRCSGGNFFSGAHAPAESYQEAAGTRSAD